MSILLDRIFIFLIFSDRKRACVGNIKIPITTIKYSSWIYLIVILAVAFLKEKDSANSLAGIVFFSFHVALFFSGNSRSLFYLTIVFACHIILGARIVYLAEAIIFGAGYILTVGKGDMRKRGVVRPYSVFGAVIILTGGLLAVVWSEQILMAFSGGDNALTAFGMKINTAGRLFMWELVLDSWIERPILGKGMPGPEEMLAHEKWSHPHNDYLRILHQTGLLGFSLWHFFILSLVGSGLRLYQRSKKGSNERVLGLSALLSFLGLFVSMFTDNVIVYSYVLYPAIALGSLTRGIYFNPRIQ